MNKFFKNLLSALLSAAIISSFCVVPAFADNAEEAVMLYEIDGSDSAADSAAANSFTEDVTDEFTAIVSDALKNYTAAELRDFQTSGGSVSLYGVSADISELNIGTESVSTIVSLIQDIIYDDPLFFYVDYQHVMYSISSSGTITTLYIALKYSPEYAEQRLTEFIETADSVITEIQSKASSDFDRVLMAHDYIVERCEYDTESATTGAIDAHGADAVLLDHKAVCQGYTSAYEYLLTQMGISCVNAYDDNEGHEWSMVKLGDNWYHVDLTFDDPTPDKLGYVSHEYFLLTDDEILSKPTHASWDKEADYSCTDETYSDVVWRDATTAVVYYGDNRYFAYSYLENSRLFTAIYETDSNFNNMSAICSLTKQLENGYTYNAPFDADDLWDYVGFYSGLCEYNDGLYFNSASAIYRLDLTVEEPTAQKVRTIVKADETASASDEDTSSADENAGSADENTDSTDEDAGSVDDGTAEVTVLNVSQKRGNSFSANVDTDSEEEIEYPYYTYTSTGTIYGSYAEDGILYYAYGVTTSITYMDNYGEVYTYVAYIGTDDDNIQTYSLDSKPEVGQYIDADETVPVQTVTDEESGETTLEGTISVELGSAISAEDTTVYLAVYENGILKQILMKTVSELAEDSTFAVAAAYDADSEYTYKVFAWGENYIPYSQALEQSIEIQ